MVAPVLAALAIGVAGSAGVVGCDAVPGVHQHAPAATVPEPVRALRLPNYRPGSLSEAQTRTVYTQGELRMRQLNDQLMFEERNALRSWARTLMSNRALAALLNTFEPNLTFEDLVAKNQTKGLSGNDLYNAMITSATHSRGSVNDFLGVDPAIPPPLPPAPALTAAPTSGGS